MYEELANSLRICGKIRSADDYCVAFHDGCCEAEPVCMYELMMKAADAIEELSRDLDSMNEANIALYGALPRWIPVEERLPEKYVSVWAYSKFGMLQDEYIGEYDGENYFARQTTHVTHWMPLPSTEGLNET